MAYQGNSPAANFQSLPAVQRFNGTGSATAFTLASVVANDQSILVSVDGVTQDSNAYAVSGTTLTFTAAPSSGTGNIFVNTISPVGSTVVPPDGSVTPVRTTFFISQATAPSSPSEGDMWFNSSASTVSDIGSKTSAVYNGTRWRQMSEPIFTATGGTITTSGEYTIHTFTSSGTFSPVVSGTVDYLVVAGGGAGGNYGGGGGAGGFRTALNFSVAATGLTVTIGAGGTGSSSQPTSGGNGANSVFSTITSTGGGGGGGNNPSTTEAQTGKDGGSGGGASNQNATGAAGAGTLGQGFAGGLATGSGTSNQSGGGGGASAVGVAGSGSGNGGAGIVNSFSGSSVTYAGGGGGGGSAQTGASGGAGGGGGYGVAGTANTGGGGGAGNGNSASARNGGSGIVIIRYLT